MVHVALIVPTSVIFAHSLITHKNQIDIIKIDSNKRHFDSSSPFPRIILQHEPRKTNAQT
jgi:hypothetical protein